MTNQKQSFVFSTPVGNLRAVYENSTLKELDLTNQKESGSPANRFEEKLVYEFKEYFSGRLKKFSITINPEGTAFQKKVWDRLLKVKYGETWTYRKLALEVEKETYARAVANAAGKNPVMIIIPCHRIVGSHGIGGYSGGIEIKQKLLNLESAQTDG